MSMGFTSTPKPININKKIVYVTGCLGFIGFYVAKKCMEAGWHVIGIDKMTYAANPDREQELKIISYDNNVEFDLLPIDINDLERLVDCDYVINCAAETHVDNSIDGSDVFLKSNINGVHHLLKLITAKGRYGMPIFLHFSTDEVYGDITDGSFSEDHLLHPSNPYSATKAAADQLILAWARTHEVPYVIVRPTNNYGAGQYVEKLIPKAVKFLQLGRKVPLHLGGTPRRTWLHVEDTADAVIHIVNSGTVNEVYNIPGNFEISNLEVVEAVVREFHGPDANVQDYINTNYERPGADLRYSIDGKKLRDLGFASSRDFYKEIASIVKYHKDNWIW
jgi:dTDP-glucose 4,6-dehydratase